MRKGAHFSALQVCPIKTNKCFKTTQFSGTGASTLIASLGHYHGPRVRVPGTVEKALVFGAKKPLVCGVILKLNAYY